MNAPRKIFGTDGVRGTANIEPVTAETALRLGRAAGHVFKNIALQSRGRGRHKIVIGKDTRLSGYMLENALSSGILSMGVDVLFIGPLPTPGVAYVTRSLRADAGIVITASHNPYDDNGIKFFRADGYKLDDKVEYEIEDLVFSGKIEDIRPTADNMAVAALDLLARDGLKEKTLVATVMSNAGLDAAVQAAGGRVVRTDVGDRNVIDEMLRHGFNLGGEQSGHMIFRDFSTTGDGLVAALQVLRIMKSKGAPLSRVARCWTRFPQLVTNILVREKRPLEELDNVPKLVAEAETELRGPGGRILLRYFGTEPKARLLLEGRDAAILETWTKKISEAIKKQVGA